MADEVLLASTRVQPLRLTQSGFIWRQDAVAKVLRAKLATAGSTNEKPRN